MSILGWLMGNESEYEDCDYRLVMRDTKDDTTYTYGGNWDQKDNAEFLEQRGFEVVEDNRGILRKLFGV